ncbi:hypothetical protein RRSWK_04045 [Rhodopirellula sp. SWK7]|nr:hypothetical protein RRSWK_04045 [Rhodopirellula sp. SWK7]
MLAIEFQIALKSRVVLSSTCADTPLSERFERSSRLRSIAGVFVDPP